MKKVLFAIAGISLIISATVAAQTKPRLSIDALNPRLLVVEGKQIVVNQEPIFFTKKMKNVRVTWHVPSGSAYRFDKDGVVIDNAADEFVDCRPAKDGKSFSCLNKHTKPGKYKYTVTLQGRPAIAPLDPVLVND